MKRTVTIHTTMVLDEAEYDSWLSERIDQWFEDEPKQINNLIKNGSCSLEDATGTTTIIVKEVAE